MDSLTFLTSGIAPYILGTLLFLSMLAFAVSIKQWREMKRSPYFFQRLQAGKRLQAYLSTSLVLFIIAAGVAAYAWRTPPDTTLRVAILTNTKPATAEIVELLTQDPLVEAVTESAIAQTQGPIQLVGVSDTFAVEAATLPDQFNQFDATAELTTDTALGRLSFSTEITDNYEAINPRRIYSEGFYTIYATFSYEGMADGMEWAWVWRHDGKVVDGGNEIWQYGDSGPGYIYFGPEEGFGTGQYTLEIWVNEELITAGSVVMNDSAVTAGN